MAGAQRSDIGGYPQLNGRVHPDNKQWLTELAAELGVSRDAVLDTLLAHARTHLVGQPEWEENLPRGNRGKRGRRRSAPAQMELLAG